MDDDLFGPSKPKRTCSGFYEMYNWPWWSSIISPPFSNRQPTLYSSDSGSKGIPSPSSSSSCSPSTSYDVIVEQAPALRPITCPLEKRRLIQQQLVLLLHAHKCQQRESENSGQGSIKCQLPHCSTMKQVLQHMADCKLEKNCDQPHCASSRQIILHWKKCERTDCPVCGPLKQLASEKRDPSTLLDVNGSGPGDASIFSPDMTGAGTSNVTAGIPIQQRHPQNQGMSDQQQQWHPGMMQPNTPQMSGQMIRPPVQAPSQPPSMSGKGGGGGRHLAPTSSEGGSLTSSLPPPEPPRQPREWHRQVQVDLRNHLVTKLVKAIFPSPETSAALDPRLKDLIQYARKVEKEMFEQAQDREEYYHLLAEKIYKIQKELLEKKVERIGKKAKVDPPPNMTAADQHAPPNVVIGPMGGGTTMAGARDDQASMVQQRQMSLSSYGGSTENMFASNNPQQPNVTINTYNKQASIARADSFNMSLKQEPLSIKSDDRPSSSLDIKPDVKPSTSAASSTPTISSVLANKSKSKIQPCRKKFAPDELRNALMPVWQKLHDMEEGIPFRVPVDPELLEIPDYFDIISRPMDLTTIKDKFVIGEYPDPWTFVDDIWLMFDNAWLYNRKNSKVYKYCNKLRDVFVDTVHPVMRRLGYCCGERRSFTPFALFCYGQPSCTIARDQDYWMYETKSNAYGVNVCERYIYCQKCFDNLPDSGINLSDDPEKLIMVPKVDFSQAKNDKIDYEPFVNCLRCERKWHRICALWDEKVYAAADGFVCENCRKDLAIPKPENKFSAKKLPECHLSRHIEVRVNNFLHAKEARAGDVVIRVLNACDKEVDVKAGMRAKYPNFPAKFPYRSKAIFAFENIEGHEVCFFGLHVQEYGSQVPSPNKRRVYIAYLDSVHFFMPREYRTMVYHEILLAYFEYCKKLGYTMAHLWACPPQEGDDYIFHCHPPEQKIPKPKRLQDWYKKMLDKGIIEHLVVDYKNIYNQVIDDGIKTPADMPYFEGDYWPNVIEDCIREADQEQSNEQAVEQADTSTPGNDKSKKQSKSKKASSKKKAKGGGNVFEKLLSNMDKHKDVFFTIRLKAPGGTAEEREIEDPDPLVSCDLMDTRDAFLNKARDEHWEFSDLRRAKYATMCMCYQLHTQGKDTLQSAECNVCKAQGATWHCNTCEDFDLCNKCKETQQHMHPLVQNMNLIDGGDSKQGDNAVRDENIKKCIQSLVHACSCKDANCRRLSCHKMKKVVLHAKTCKRRQDAACQVCKQLIALCCYHAKNCSVPKCAVPFCDNIRQKLAEQRQAQRRQADRMMMRRMGALNVGANKPQHPGMPGPPMVSNVTPSPMLSQSFGGNNTNSYQPTAPNSTQHHFTPSVSSTQSMPMSSQMVSNSLLGAAPSIQPGMFASPQQSHNNPSQQNYIQQNRPMAQPMPNGGIMAQQGQPPPYRSVAPQGRTMTPFDNQEMYRNQQQAQNRRGMAPMASQGMPPMQSRQMTPQQIQQQQMQPGSVSQQQVQAIIQRIQQARTQQERDTVMGETKKNPVLFSAVITELHRMKQSQQQPGMMAPMGGGQPQQQWAPQNNGGMQQQFANGQYAPQQQMRMQPPPQQYPPNQQQQFQYSRPPQ